ncbi:hypothetical protein ALNOE001_05170 [Candidatus Methanobinarius endosymbioticus]|uniref:Uncharacterized protein n=1 Tax=Candidatus Methanobinarius endosymbioticus TaxID=2006182 RepID=A0A366MF59_9EURY|nr:hypothetical protein ALNOE001_05170 [Candidatus Methanobinarius endosymbioticus]
MNKIIKYGIIGIVFVVIILFGLNIIFTSENAGQKNIIDKIININGNNEENVSKNNNTMYKYGNSEIVHIKSKANVNSFISQLNKEQDLKKINIDKISNNSNIYQTSDGMYAVLIINSEKTEAIFIKSPTQEELIKAAEQTLAGGDFIGQLNDRLNNFKINGNPINKSNNITITNII